MLQNISHGEQVRDVILIRLVEKLKTDQVLFYTYNCQIYLCNYILKKKYYKMFKFSLLVTMTTLKLKPSNHFNVWIPCLCWSICLFVLIQRNLYTYWFTMKFDWSHSYFNSMIFLSFSSCHSITFYQIWKKTWYKNIL